MEEPTRGRPRVWADTRARKLAHQQRQRTKLLLIDALLDAVRNAHWDDDALYRRIQEGDDAGVLQALIEHYQARHWCRVQQSSGPTKGGDGEGKT